MNIGIAPHYRLGSSKDAIFEPDLIKTDADFVEGLKDEYRMTFMRITIC